MTEASDYLIGAMLIGAGATLVLDLWTAILRRCGLSSLDYALVGRWFAYMTSGIFRHHPIAASPAVRGERLIGWSAHYLIGVVFAGVLLACGGLDWICHPTILPALTIGIGSVLLPFLLMQPGMGAGIAASRTPRPAVARLRSLVTHGVSASASTPPAGSPVAQACSDGGAFARAWTTAPGDSLHAPPRRSHRTEDR